ncbi:MAG: endolytic transglycosylase MltG [Oscillospiraceae bacterium]|nr:endolytic transglycosylase MltG [Oscillospiraceae bacterium]
MPQSDPGRSEVALDGWFKLLAHVGNFSSEVVHSLLKTLALYVGNDSLDGDLEANFFANLLQVSTDRELVASVIYNRLGSSSISRLQIDATVVYAFYTMGQIKDTLTYEDLEVDSLYNTYKYEGLPPGPISNPGIAAIKAAINPASTNYYFYALKSDGSHYFSRTYEEHQNFLASQGQ